MNRLHAPLAALAALLVVLLVPASAGAVGTYTVSQCDARTGSTLAGWRAFSAGGWKAANNCPMNARLSANKPGRYAALRTPVMPAELGISRVSFLASGLRAKNAKPEAGFCKTTPAKKLCDRQVTRRVAKSSRKAHSIEYVWHPKGKQTGGRAFELALRHTGAAGSATSPAFLNARHFKFTINDNTKPTVSADSSAVPAVTANTTFKLPVSGSDKGGGIAGFWLTVTGAADTASSRYLAASCDYSKWQPCAAQTSRTFTINTADFENGPATLTLTSEDAAGNRSTPFTVGFTVSRTTIDLIAGDTTPPPTPGPVTYLGGGCEAATDLNWSYPVTSDDGTPFVAVKVTFALWESTYPVDVQINEMYGAQSWTLPLGTTEDTDTVTLSSIGRLRLPTINPNASIYAAMIQIVDEAGNVSDPSLFFMNSDACPS